ncbi:hypothetical protein VRC02_08140 [Erwinia sp. E_sp_B01_3]|uniref:hypothetical protein n=1 Tax=Erwinia sp. E_sp_B01_3 TaxID=3039402 RepID=UPI0030CF4E16
MHERINAFSGTSHCRYAAGYQWRQQAVQRTYGTEQHRPAYSFRSVCGGGGTQWLWEKHPAASAGRAGKTTSGDLLAGNAPLSEARDDTRLMFQDDRLLPWKSVIDNVGLGLKGKSWKKMRLKLWRR